MTDRTTHRPNPGGRPTGEATPPSRSEFARRALIAAGIAVGTLAVVVAFARASDIFFLFFAGILLAILLRSTSDALARRTGLGPGWSLAAVVGTLVALAATAAYGAGAMAVAQFNQLADDLPRSLDQARAYLRQYPWGDDLLRQAPTVRELVAGGQGSAASHAVTFFSTTFGVVGNLVVLAFLSLYLAATPRTYVEGAVTLVPPARRGRAREVLNAVGFHLKWWLIGRLVAMAAVGVITGIGLWLVGVPQFLVLAAVAALLTAIPYIGPILGAAPGVLVALMQGPSVALWAVAVYVLAQAVENYLITPLVQQNTAGLPPVVSIAAVTLAGVLFGALGLVVATPLAVAVMVAVKMLYVEDALGDRLDVPGADGGA
jgi:predicted PurR-regulated permease PerM